MAVPNLQVSPGILTDLSGGVVGLCVVLEVSILNVFICVACIEFKLLAVKAASPTPYPVHPCLFA